MKREYLTAICSQRLCISTAFSAMRWVFMLMAAEGQRTAFSAPAAAHTGQPFSFAGLEQSDLPEGESKLECYE
jgi:hypothetical protein